MKNTHILSNLFLHKFVIIGGISVWYHWKALHFSFLVLMLNYPFLLINRGKVMGGQKSIFPYNYLQGNRKYVVKKSSMKFF